MQQCRARPSGSLRVVWALGEQNWRFWHFVLRLLCRGNSFYIKRSSQLGSSPPLSWATLVNSGVFLRNANWLRWGPCQLSCRHLLERWRKSRIQRCHHRKENWPVTLCWAELQILSFVLFLQAYLWILEHWTWAPRASSCSPKSHHRSSCPTSTWRSWCQILWSTLRRVSC